jgi:hypothetical protein
MMRLLPGWTRSLRLRGMARPWTRRKPHCSKALRTITGKIATASPHPDTAKVAVRTSARRPLSASRRFVLTSLPQEDLMTGSHHSVC